MNKTIPETPRNEIRKAPWHLWVVGIAGLLWSAMGAMDYIMTQTQNEAYMNAFNPEQLEFFYGLPFWAVASWAFGVALLDQYFCCYARASPCGYFWHR